MNIIKEIKCKRCGKIVRRFSNSKYCLDCVYKINLEKKKEYDRRYREKYRDKVLKQKKESYRKGKKYKCIFCKKEFQRANWYPVGKYCSRTCFELDMRNKRKGKGNPAYRNGMRVQGVYTVKHLRACRKYRNEFLKKHNYLYCEFCGVNQSLRFETHHIIWASEKPGHKNLHNKKNLILLCIKCHNNFHKNKKLRNELVKKRKLDKLFNVKI